MPASSDPKNTAVMILAAGKGERMRPLTLHTPKPLLKAGHKSLMAHHLSNLSLQGFKDIVINHAYLGEQIVATLGDGKQWGLTISYSDESALIALETAGGIINALPLIQSDAFLVVNGDIFTEFDFASLVTPLSKQARIVLVPNPEHNPEGDFQLTTALAESNSFNKQKFTFSGIGYYKKSFFQSHPIERLALGPLLREGIKNGLVETVFYPGTWRDIGTPQRLQELDEQLTKTAI